MIKNHEDITYELTDYELDLARRIAPILKSKTKENPVLAKQIIDGCNSSWNLSPKLTDVRLRKIINIKINSSYYTITNITSYSGQVDQMFKVTITTQNDCSKTVNIKDEVYSSSNYNKIKVGDCFK